MKEDIKEINKRVEEKFGHVSIMNCLRVDNWKDVVDVLKIGYRNKVLIGQYEVIKPYSYFVISGDNRPTVQYTEEELLKTAMRTCDTCSQCEGGDCDCCGHDPHCGRTNCSWDTAKAYQERLMEEGDVPF